MPFAYWCVLIAALLPLAIVSYAKAGSGGDNHNPRAGIDSLEPAKRRAYAAHQNAFESFPFFAAAVIIASTSAAGVCAGTTVSLQPRSASMRRMFSFTP